jgi:hypothetical protein
MHVCSFYFLKEKWEYSIAGAGIFFPVKHSFSLAFQVLFLLLLLWTRQNKTRKNNLIIRRRKK